MLNEVQNNVRRVSMSAIRKLFTTLALTDILWHSFWKRISDADSEINVIQRELFAEIKSKIE